MNGERITIRQQALLRRSAELRQALALQTNVLQTPLALADRLRESWRWLRGHPELPLAAGAILLVLRPRGAWRWGHRLWWGWRALQRLERSAARR